jgi:hypothetical protein
MLQLQPVSQYSFKGNSRSWLQISRRNTAFVFALSVFIRASIGVIRVRLFFLEKHQSFSADARERA